MKKLIILSAVAVALNVRAAEYFVDPAKGNDTNAGSAAAPFATVRAAIKAASPTGGDTITLRGGTYREAFSLNDTIIATAENPFVIQGAEGERAIVTGFEPITGWKIEIAPSTALGERYHTYTAEVPELINGLLVGLEPQPLTRWPRTASGWIRFGNGNSNTMSFAVFDALNDNIIPNLRAILTDMRSAQMFAYLNQPSVYNTYPIKSLDLRGLNVFVAMPRGSSIYTGQGKFAIQNHPLLIEKSGDWACAAEGEDGKKFRVYFRNAWSANLTNTFYRTRGSLVSLRGASGVVIRNLEVSGAGRTGIETFSAKDCLIERCIVHNCYSYGISVRNSKNMIVRSNISVANEDIGLSIASTDNALVEGNEVCFNMVDGLRVIGNASGRPGTEPDSTNVTVRRNYLHHHYYLSHPDNMQTFKGVTGLKIVDNVMLFGGQNIMTQENSDSEMRGNVSMFTTAYTTIFGHKSAHRWTVTGNTVGHGGWGSFTMDGEGYAFFDNLFIGTGLTIRPDTKSDNNVFVTRPYAPDILYVGYMGQKEMTKAREVTQTDAHSLAFDDVKFKNMPKAFSLYERADDPNSLATATYIPFRTRGSGGGTIGKPADFAVGDNIEINGDGIMRKVTATDDKGITFTPALPMPPFRDAFVLNWGDSTSTTLDLAVENSHPLMTAARDGKRAGSALDIAAFQRGELLETGKRNLPIVPDDLKAAWPNPNFYIAPMHGR